MLVKINGILQSAAPNEEAPGAGGGSETSGADTTTGGETETTSESDTSGEGSQESGEGDEDFSNDFNFDEFLQYDPFEEKPAGNKSESTAGATDESAGDKKTSEKSPAPAPAADPKLALLEQQVAQLTQALEAQRQQADTTAAEKTQTQGAKTPEQVQQERHARVSKTLPNYSFNIPDDVMQKMGSEDPATIKAGLADFASGVASVAHYNVAMQFEERIAELEQQLLEKSVQTFKQTTAAETQAAQTRKTVFDDFYGKYPELNKPELQQFVQMQAATLAKQYGVSGWSDQFRDTLGLHVKKILGMQSEQGPPPDAGQTTQKSGKKPGTRFNSASGTGGRATGSAADDIADTLFS